MRPSGWIEEHTGLQLEPFQRALVDAIETGQTPALLAPAEQRRRARMQERAARAQLYPTSGRDVLATPVQRPHAATRQEITHAAD